MNFKKAIFSGVLSATVLASSVLVPVNAVLNSDIILPTQNTLTAQHMKSPADINMSEYNATGKVNYSTVNIRSGPSTSYSKLGTINLHSVVTIVGKFNTGWYKICYDNSYAYISSTYISNVKTVDYPNDKDMTAIEGTASNKYSLNVRSGTSVLHTKIGLFLQNTDVTLVGKFSNGWYKVIYRNGFGYVSGVYLQNLKSTEVTTTTTVNPTVALTSTTSTTATPTTVTTTTTNPSNVTSTGLTTANLNVRKGNSTAYSILGVIAKNTRVNIIQKMTNGWYKIEYKNGYGFVSGYYLKDIEQVTTSTTTQTTSTTLPTTTSTTKASTTTIPSTTIITTTSDYTEMNSTGVTTANLNARAGTSTSYAVLGVIPKGTKINIVGKHSNGWYKISYKNNYAFVSGNYVKDIKDVEVTTTTTTTTTTIPTTLTTTTTIPTTLTTTKPSTSTTVSTTLETTSTTQATTLPEQTYQTGLTTANLNVRVSPSTSSSKLTTISKGTSITIVSKDGDWYKITYGSSFAYVYGKYVTITQTVVTTTTAPDLDDVDYGMIEFIGSGKSTASLNVRSGPSTSYEKLGLLYNGENIDIYGRFEKNGSTSWYKIAYSGGYGYVYADYISNIETDSGSGPIYGNATIVEVIEDDTRIFDSKCLKASSYYYAFDPDNSYLPIGTKDYLVKEFTKYGMSFYELSSGICILSEKAKTYKGDAYGANTLTATSASTSNNTVLTIDSNWNVPFNVSLAPQSYSVVSPSVCLYSVKDFTAEYIDIKFYYTTDIVGEFNVNGSTVVKDAKWVKNSDQTYSLRLNLKQKGVFFGYSSYYENGKLIISLNDVPSVSVANNSYGVSLDGVRVWIDAGHGGRDSGAVGYAKRSYEKTLNLQIALKLKEQLTELGATVGMTRTDDTYYSLDDRVKMAEDFGADLFLSVHHDSSDATSASGTSAFYYFPYSFDFASSIHDEIVSAYKNYIYNTSSESSYYNRVDRNTTQNVFLVTRSEQFQSTLVEYGFTSNSYEQSKLMNEYNQNKLVDATVDGFVNYLKGLQ